MQKKNVLFINGIPDNKTVELNTMRKNGTFIWDSAGSANISPFLQNELFRRHVITFDTNPEQDIELNNIHAVFNEISDPDTHRITLGKAENFHKSIAGKVPFYNTATNIMKTTRDNIYQLLQDIDKLHVPKTVRIQPRSSSDIYDAIEKENFDFPIIFRQAGDHGGISTLRIDNNSEQFYAFPLDGRDYYLTQFVDYANKDGIYTKYRLIIVDGEVFIRHAIFSNEWAIHGDSRKSIKNHKRFEDDILKSFDRKIKPKIRSAINEIYNKMGLDYFGIDCHIDEQFNIVVFEINSSMNVISDDSDNTRLQKIKIKFIKNALVKMIGTHI
ncbi:ATP-grasp domain-containing protein [Sulfurovum riftiae]|uniref:ATP-grasp domain-containing protein n=1 Tax=Sulfurovum riftiae TaxID=1630136 RepID=A0A151CGH2_9BACT|nr:hypothetical protein [Sulfurovum riftiae]KYJ86645.1 hypothetical protein AS592_00065 [Sulfurovum riftiae]